jgi:signal transduction histidine kinase
MGRAQSLNVRPLSPGRPLGLAMVAVVVSFTASLAISHYTARTIDANAAGITGDAAPSILHLVQARTELRRLATYPSLYLLSRATTAPAAHTDIEASIRRLNTEWSVYRTLPALPGEAEMTFEAEREIKPLLDAVARLTDRIDHSDPSGAGRLWQSEMLPDVDRVDGGLAHLIEHHTTYARVRAEEISRVRHRGAMTALGLGLFSVLLAAGATVLGFQTLRRHERLEEERNRLARARADELELFASRVAHDIKSPLGAVGLALQVARKSGDRERIESVTRRALGSLQRVQQIVDGLLDFAKAGARPEPGSATPLGLVIDEVVDEVRPVADQLGVRIVVRRAADPWVACAPGAVASVVSNLLRNAIKYAGERQDRKVEVRVLDRAVCARLEVEDDGPGIPNELQLAIFEPYVRAPGSTEPGIGLGLATVKRLVEAHGGRVGIRSTVGQGSCFWVELPKVSPRNDGSARLVTPPPSPPAAAG